MGFELWANHIRLDPGAIGNILGNASRNTLGTWELFGNLSLSLPISKKRRKRNCMIHECMLSFLIASMKFLFPKLLVTIFGLG